MVFKLTVGQLYFVQTLRRPVPSRRPLGRLRNWAWLPMKMGPKDGQFVEVASTAQESLSWFVSGGRG